MTAEKAIKMREKYPVPTGELNRHSSFEQILGRNESDYTHNEKQERWNKVMSLSHKSVKADWLNTETCYNCSHLNGSWCKLVDLPCTVNPILSFQFGIPGMACRGAGLKCQPTLFDDDDDEPAF